MIRLPAKVMSYSLLLSASLLFAPLGYAELSLDQAVRLVEREHGGRVLDIQRVTTGEGSDYRIKLLQPSGRLKLLMIDAEDGRPRDFSEDSGKGRERGRGRGRGDD